MLKKQHAEQKDRVEEKKRHLEEEMKDFQRRKFSLEQSRLQVLGTLKNVEKYKYLGVQINKDINY